MTVQPVDRALRLDPYIVVEGYRRRELAQAIADEMKRREHEQFSFFAGGPLWQNGIRKVKVALGGWSSGNALGLLRISW